MRGPLKWLFIILAQAGLMSGSLASNADAQAGANAPSAHAAGRTADFVGGIGVNTHIGQWWTAYKSDTQYGGDPRKVLDGLSYLGLNLVRDEVPSYDPNALWNSSLPEYEQIAAAGVHFDLEMRGDRGVADQIAIVDRLQRGTAGSVIAVEGPNEVNHYPVHVNGESDAAAVLAFQAAIRDAVRSDPLLDGVPVVNFSLADGTGDFAAAYAASAPLADYGNAHVYQGAAAPAASVAAHLAGATALVPGKPVVVTEAGYYTVPNAGSWGSVSESVQAKYTLDMLMDDALQGVRVTYLYELLDNGVDAAGTYDADNHFGLFNADGTPKQAATAIRNLTTILHDPGADAGSFATNGLGYAISDLPATGGSLLLQQSDGRHDLVLWAEPEIWNRATLGEVDVPATPVTVTLDGSYRTVRVYDPLTGTAPIRSYDDVGTLTLSLTDHPLIVEIGPDRTASPVPAPPSGSADDAAAPSTTASVTAPTASEAVSVSTVPVVDPTPLVPVHSVGSLAGGVVYTDPLSAGGQADLVYSALLGRLPDPVALGYYAALQAGAGTAQVAARIMASPEYGMRFASQDADGFVSGLYGALLGRAPDAAGLSYWAGLLESGGTDRAGLAASLAASPEVARVQAGPGASGGLAAGVCGIAPAALTVLDAYQTVFGRAPDGAGLTYWTGQLQAGLSARDLLHAFMASPEFMAGTGAASDAGFASAIEFNAEGGPDPAGVAYWTAALAGGVARVDVVAAYAASPGVAAQVAPLVTSGGIAVPG